ncbi:MAG: hypothetical protein U0X76_03235 [Bacteroidia bacterium]
MDITNTGGKRIASSYFNVSNLADLAYQSHLSRLKYAPENYLTARSESTIWGGPFFQNPDTI